MGHSDGISHYFHNVSKPNSALWESKENHKQFFCNWQAKQQVFGNIFTVQGTWTFLQQVTDVGLLPLIDLWFPNWKKYTGSCSGNSFWIHFLKYFTPILLSLLNFCVKWSGSVYHVLHWDNIKCSGTTMSAAKIPRHSCDKTPQTPTAQSVTNPTYKTNSVELFCQHVRFLCFQLHSKTSRKEVQPPFNSTNTLSLLLIHI